MKTGPILLALALATGARAQDLVISEVSGDGVGFIEIENRGASRLELGGWHVVGEVQHVFKPGLSLGGGDRIVLTHSLRALEQELGVSLVVVDELWGRLHPGGELRLFDPKGRLRDAVRYPVLPRGRSFQRRPSSSAYRGPLAWTAGEPSPGRANAVPPFEPALALDEPARTPVAPSTSDAVAISVRVHGGPARVRVRFESRDERGEVALVASSSDAAVSSVAVFGATLPPLRGIVSYALVADDERGNVARLDEDPLTGQRLRYAPLAPAGRVPVLRLEVEPRTLDAVLAGAVGSATVIDGDRSPPAIIEDARLEVAAGHARRSWQKPSLRLHLPPGTDLRGRRSLDLRTSLDDESYLREALALDLYRRCGVPAPGARLVRVEIGGAFFGLYTEVERIDARFLARSGLAGAFAFQGRPGHAADGRPLPTLADYRLAYEAKPDAPYTELRDFLEGLDACPEERLERFLEERLDLERYLRYLAANAIASDWDSIGRHVHWCFDAARTRRWLAIPWNVDRTWGEPARGHRLVALESPVLGTRDRPRHGHGDRGPVAWDRVRDRVLSCPPVRARFHERLAELARAELGPLAAEIDGRIAAIADDALLDRERWPLVADTHDGRLTRRTFSRARLRRAAKQLELYARDRALFLAKTDAREPLSRPERRAALARELLALGGLFAGIALYARLLRRRP